MAFTRKRPHIESDESSSDGDDLEQQLLNLSKKSKQSIATNVGPPMMSDSGKDGSDSSTDEDDDEWTLHSEGKNSKKKKGKITEKKKSVSDHEEEDGEIADDEPEDGEVSSSSSDDGSDEDLPAFDDGLDENLIGNEDDRLMLEQMTEKEREQELFNRMEKREAMKTRLEIEHKLHTERKRERKNKKEKHKDTPSRLNDKVTYFNSIASRKGERKRNLIEDKKLKAMDELKQKRIEKREKLENRNKKEPLNTKDVYSDEDDEEEESEKVEAADSDKSSVELASDDEEEKEEDKPISSREQLEKIRLSRFKLEKWVHLPFLPRVVTGCFVRMGIGNHDGRSIYRVAEVIGVTETPKVYNLGSTRTNKGLKIRHGMQERVFRMEYVSNQQFTESEFLKWKEEMSLVELPLPTISHVKRKFEEISESKVYSFKEDDIEAMVKEKNRFRKNPFNYASTKNTLLREKELAEQAGNIAELEKVKEKLEELEERAQMLDRKRSGALNNVSFINERNRKKNIYDAERAVVEEGKLKKNDTDNPFTRRKTLPFMIMKKAVAGGASPGEKKDDKEDCDTTKPLSMHNLETDILKEKTLESLLFAPNINKVSSRSSQEDEDPDMFSAHDFDVQIDLPIPASRVMSLTPKPATLQRENFSRKSLNLDEYKKRKGLM